MTPQLERDLDRRDSIKRLNRVNTFINYLLVFEVFAIGYFIGRMF